MLTVIPRKRHIPLKREVQWPIEASLVKQRLCQRCSWKRSFDPFHYVCLTCPLTWAGSHPNTRLELWGKKQRDSLRQVPWPPFCGHVLLKNTECSMQQSQVTSYLNWPVMTVQCPPVIISHWHPKPPGASCVDLTPGWQESNYFLLRGALIILMVLILSVLGSYTRFCDHLSGRLPRCLCCQVAVEGKLELSLLLSQWSAYSPKPRSPLVSRAAG